MVLFHSTAPLYLTRRLSGGRRRHPLLEDNCERPCSLNDSAFEVETMALVTHQMQGPLARPMSLSPWNKRMKLKQQVRTLKLAGKAHRCMLSKQKICLSVGPPCRCGSKFKLLRISAFKSSVQNGESGDRENVSKVPKNSIKLKESDDSLKKTLKAINVLRSHTSGTMGGTASPLLLNKIFKKGLTMLRIQHASEEVDGIFREMPSREASATPHESHDGKRNEILEAVSFYLLGLDAMIKIPLLIFIPLYLTINVFYGAKVSRELMPLWVFGPLIVAFYIKLLHWLCALSVLSFKQTAYLIKNFPRYYKVACDYVFHGRLREEVQSQVWQPVVTIRSLDYEELSRRKFEFMKEWVVEKYFDFVESVWPYYCRAIRFLKRANLI